MRSCHGVFPCLVKIGGGVNQSLPVGASFISSMQCTFSRLPFVRSMTLNGPPPPMAELTILSTWAGVAFPSVKMRAASAQ